MKKLFIAIVFSILSSTSSAADCAHMVYNGIFPTSKEAITILCKKRYVIGFSINRKTPLWVAEALSASNVRNANSIRKNNFRVDPAISINQQASISTFIGTDFDKGHLVPFEDLADDPIAADESFFMTNIVPQVSSNNRGIWRSLESKTRKLALTYGNIFIITGPIFDSRINMMKNGTPIPTKLFKVIIIPSTKQMLTFIIPNIDNLTALDLMKYVSTRNNLLIKNNLVDVMPSGTLIDRTNF